MSFAVIQRFKHLEQKESAVEKEKAHAEGMYGILCTCKANIYMICIKKKQILGKKKFF